jgi:Derlin-2/3
MWQYFREAPPIARYALRCSPSYSLTKHRALATITFTLSLLVYIGVLPYYPFPFIPQAFLQLPPELWRIFTPFFLTDPNIGVLLDTYFCKLAPSELPSFEG